ncbi:thioredoxin family protein [Colwellia sp. D2M02]|uniref:thioredoxin family protein n=1 Tax=Colwellia sp. D2M02 TaxID=2841562 RepID=UPI001C09BBD9|nr:thioredoxin family protein [Colwellia sp. D2M02]MBU2894623.1 thioredoxin family protein [Colwellia sp. D2M02]
MKSTLFSILLSLSISGLFALSMIGIACAKSPAITVYSANNLPIYSKVYDDTRDPFKDATDALALAKTSNRQVLIEVGGNWCSWCHKMDAFLEENPDIYQALHSQYVLLKINVSDSNENEAFMSSLPPVLGYPHMYVSTSTGKMLLSKDTAELLVDGNYSREQWLTFLHKWSNSFAPKYIQTSHKLRI